MSIPDDEQQQFGSIESVDSYLEYERYNPLSTSLESTWSNEH
ncbi:hypothetical protein [Streptomyces sp. NPDC101115]